MTKFTEDIIKNAISEMMRTTKTGYIKDIMWCYKTSSFVRHDENDIPLKENQCTNKTCYACYGHSEDAAKRKNIN